MIIVNLKGGLGNQMFQYATGLALAHKNNTQILLDTSSYLSSNLIGGDTVRTFDLDQFSIIAQDATQEQINKAKYPHNFFQRILKKITHKILRHKYSDYHPELLEKASLQLSSGKNFYLDGFFQSEKNFKEIRDEIIREFTLQEEFINEKVRDFQKQIERTNSISIHIRRGDYVTNSKANKYHGLLPISYYREAIDLISETIEHPHFYIFTDDPKWTKENLKISGNNTYVSGNGLDYCQEFYLMTKCQNNIIANSSFSWWGAWLNTNLNKNVIAPKKWTVRNIEHPNIIPDGWIEI